MNSSPVATWPVCTDGRPMPSTRELLGGHDRLEAVVDELTSGRHGRGGQRRISRKLDHAEQWDLSAGEHLGRAGEIVLDEFGGDDDVTDRQVVVQRPGDAREDDRVDLVVMDERRGGERGSNLADTRLDDRDTLARERPVAIRAPGVLGGGLGVEMLVEPLDFLGHCSDHADVPVADRHRPIVGASGVQA